MWGRKRLSHHPKHPNVSTEVMSTMREERGINCNRVFSYTGTTLQRSARGKRGKETHQRIKRLLRFSGAQQGKGEGSSLVIVKNERSTSNKGGEMGKERHYASDEEKTRRGEEGGKRGRKGRRTSHKARVTHPTEKDKVENEEKGRGRTVQFNERQR